jgi:SnoaL-like domain
MAAPSPPPDHPAKEEEAMTDARKLIDRYFDLAPQPDTDAYFAQFAGDAVVEDDGQAHRGIAAIRAWRSKVPRVAYTIHDVKTASTGHAAAVDIAGDFPGSPVALTFHFQFAADGRITALTIRP